MRTPPVVSCTMYVADPWIVLGWRNTITIIFRNDSVPVVAFPKRSNYYDISLGTTTTTLNFISGWSQCVLPTHSKSNYGYNKRAFPLFLGCFYVGAVAHAITPNLSSGLVHGKAQVEVDKIKLSSLLLYLRTFPSMFVLAVLLDPTALNLSGHVESNCWQIYDFWSRTDLAGDIIIINLYVTVMYLCVTLFSSKLPRGYMVTSLGLI